MDEMGKTNDCVDEREGERSGWRLRTDRGGRRGNKNVDATVGGDGSRAMGKKFISW